MALDIRIGFSHAIAHDSQGGPAILGRGISTQGDTIYSYDDIDSICVAAAEVLEDGRSFLRGYASVAPADTDTVFELELHITPADHYRITVNVFGQRKSNGLFTEQGVVLAGMVDSLMVAEGRTTSVLVVLQDIVPKGVHCTSEDLNPLTLSWDAVDDALSYRVMEVPREGVTEFHTTSEASYTPSSPPTNSTQFRVRAELCWVSSTFSEPVIVASDALQ